MVKMLLKQERWADTYVEDRRAVLARACDACRDSETMPAKEHVRNTRVAQLGEAALLAEVEGNVAHVSLNLAECERELMATLIPKQLRKDMRGDDEKKGLVLYGVVRRELEEVVRLNRDEVREQVAPTEREVLDDEVKGVIGVLNTRDRDVSNLTEV